MTEGKKHCGLSSFLPMSCRGRAEAFARRLHNRLRSLGSHDDGDSSESSWLGSSDAPNSVTNLQPKHSLTENGVFIDFGLFDTPGSPQEEIVEPELSKFITNPTDDLHHLNLDECKCLSGDSRDIKRNSSDSKDSDSSDGPYYDIENSEFEANCATNNHVNGISLHENIPENVHSSPSEPAAPQISSLSYNISEDEDSLSDKIDKLSPEWCLNYEPQKIKNNNFYNAIDLESLKQNGTNHPEELSSSEDISSNESKTESYCSHLSIQQDLTIECPNSSIDNPVVEVSTLEIIDTDEIDKVETCLETNGTNEQTTDANHLRVENIVPIIDDTEIEERTPRVRRCSSLKTGKTPPGTPGRKKIVRFADVLGLDLADVRTFLDEIPKVPISAYEDLSGADLLSSFSSTSISSNSSVLDSIHTSVKTVVPLFQQPGGEPDFMEKIRSNQVCLENAVLKDSVILCISGTVRVRNLDFHKSVHIRYTLDSWKTFSDLQTTYIEGSCDGFSDKFSFTLYVHTLNIGQKLEFAVRFQCKGCQYWDSNGGKNYVFQCIPTSTNTSYVPISTPDENSWAGAAFY